MPKASKGPKPVRTRLKAWLKQERRTQDWLADEVAVHQTTVSDWLNGRDIPLAKALRISELSGLSAEDIAVIEAPSAAESSPVLPESDDDEPASATGTEG